MKGFIRPAVRAVAALLLLLLVVVPAPAKAAAPRAFFGMMVDGPFIEPLGFDLAAEARLMRRTGVGSVRFALYWDRVEPVRGTRDWSSYDALVGTLARQGLRTFPVLVRAPAWARVGDPALDSSPPRVRAFRRFAAAAVDRYGARGSFWRERRGLPRRPVRQWQIWNEPNAENYWNVRPWAPSYTRMLRATYRTIKRADRRAKVVSAGLTGDFVPLIRELYGAGAKGAFDAIALHAYRETVSSVIGSLAQARRMIRRRGDRARIVASEISFSSGLGRSTTNYGIERTEAGQRRALVRVMRRLVAERRSLGLASVYWYTWVSYPPGLANSFQYSGLRQLTEQGTLESKPALSGFRQVAR